MELAKHIWPETDVRHCQESTCDTTVCHEDVQQILAAA